MDKGSGWCYCLIIVGKGGEKYLLSNSRNKIEQKDKKEIKIKIKKAGKMKDQTINTNKCQRGGGGG
ncbi:hypothetical protein, partial [Neomoorella humiferrea]|uniref:hypothetical protein n=1 Tax=Neomoorella humiferrea TaxID=676965 RepID=UPI001B7FFE32